MKTVIVGMFLVVSMSASAALIASCSPPAGAASAAEQKEAKVTLEVNGMTCASCSLTVRVTLERLDGVKSAVVSVEQNRAEVAYDPSKVTPQQMAEAVTKAGYRSRVASSR